MTVAEKKIKAMTKKSIKETLELFGRKRDAWQITEIYQAFKKGDYYLSGPRQIGKTTLASDMALICAIKGLKVLFLCHRLDNVNDLMTNILPTARSLQGKGVVTKISPSHGFNYIYFKSGGRIFFKVRTPGVSVGLTFDVVIWDEAQKVDPAIVAEIKPILMMSNERIQLSIGTPPRDEDWRKYPNNPFMRAKKKGGDNYKEFSAAPEYSPDIKITKENAMKANPAGKRIKDFWKEIQASAENMDHESFCGQYFGVWKSPTKIDVNDPYLSTKDVENMITEKGSTNNRFTASIGISPMSDMAYIAFNDGTTVEIVESFEISMGGLDEIIGWVKSRMNVIKVVRLPSTARGKALFNEFKAIRLDKKIRVMSMPEFSNNLSRFLKQTKEGSLKIYNAHETAIALSSFWLAVDIRSGSHDVKAANPDDVTLMMALVNSTIDEKLLNRSSATGTGSKGFIF